MALEDAVFVELSLSADALLFAPAPLLFLALAALVLLTSGLGLDLLLLALPLLFNVIGPGCGRFRISRWPRQRAIDDGSSTLHGDEPLCGLVAGRPLQADKRVRGGRAAGLRLRRAFRGYTRGSLSLSARHAGSI